jgi:hypothetical protein
MNCFTIAPALFREDFAKAENKNKKKFLQIKKMILPLQPLCKNEESVLKKFGPGVSVEEKSLRNFEN